MTISVDMNCTAGTRTPEEVCNVVLGSSKMDVAVETVMPSGDDPNRLLSCPSTIPTD